MVNQNYVMERMHEFSKRNPSASLYLSNTMARYEAEKHMYTYEYSRTSKIESSFKVSETRKSSKDLVDAEREASKDYELDPMPNDMDEKQLQKIRKRGRDCEDDKESEMCQQTELKEVDDKLEAIRSENKKLTKELMRYAEECGVLKSENEALLEELRNVCDKEMISRLEAMDPDPRHVLSDDEPEHSSQNQQASSESD